MTTLHILTWIILYHGQHRLPIIVTCTANKHLRLQTAPITEKNCFMVLCQYYSETGCDGIGMCGVLQKIRQWLGEEMYGVLKYSAIMWHFC